MPPLPVFPAVPGAQPVHLRHIAIVVHGDGFYGVHAPVVGQAVEKSPLLSDHLALDRQENQTNLPLTIR